VRCGLRTKLLDFGIAKLVGEISLTKTRTGTFVGTPTYGSPEQCRGGHEIDERSDVYSLGCVVHEMVSGQPPFSGSGAGDVIAAHIYLQPPLLGDQAPRWLGALVHRMLAKHPHERPTMTEVAAELDAAGDVGALGELATAMAGPAQSQSATAAAQAHSPWAVGAQRTRIERTPIVSATAREALVAAAKMSPPPTIPMPMLFPTPSPTIPMPVVIDPPSGPKTTPMPTVCETSETAPEPPPTLPMDVGLLETEDGATIPRFSAPREPGANMAIGATVDGRRPASRPGYPLVAAPFDGAATATTRKKRGRSWRGPVALYVGFVAVGVAVALVWRARPQEASPATVTAPTSTLASAAPAAAAAQLPSAATSPAGAAGSPAGAAGSPAAPSGASGATPATPGSAAAQPGTSGAPSGAPAAAAGAPAEASARAPSPSTAAPAAPTSDAPASAAHGPATHAAATPATLAAPSAPATAATAPAADSAEPAPAATPEAARSAQELVIFAIDSQPPGASVYRDGDTERLGKTPWTHAVPRAARPVTFVLRLPGYHHASVTLAADHDDRQSVTLSRVRPPTPARPAAPAPDTPSPPPFEAPPAATDPPAAADPPAVTSPPAATSPPPEP
jgi:hypothetical protein